MKKFLAGALAAALALSFPATAFAAKTKTVTKMGEVEIEVSAVMPDTVLKLSLPGDMKIAINPYGNDIKLTELEMIRTNNGIVSVAYPVLNYETDCGVFFDAKATTRTSSSTWSVTKTPVKAGVKGANMSFTASDTPEGIAVYSNQYKQATSVSSQGNLPLDSTSPYSQSKGLAKGQTKQRKVAYIPASKDGVTPSQIYIGFAGKLAEDSKTTDVDWTEKDVITVNLILSITPAPKNLGAEPEPDPIPDP